MSANTVAVTDATFETDVLNATGPVLVDFWAEWCGPCKMIAPALDEIGAEFAGQVFQMRVIDGKPREAGDAAHRGVVDGHGRRTAEKE